jgi:hypothetical protein
MSSSTAGTASFSHSSPSFQLTLTGTLSWLQHQFTMADDKSSASLQEQDAGESSTRNSVLSLPLWSCDSPMPTVASAFSYTDDISEEDGDDEDVELQYEMTILHTAYPLQRS